MALSQGRIRLERVETLKEVVREKVFEFLFERDHRREFRWPLSSGPALAPEASSVSEVGARRARATTRLSAA